MSENKHQKIADEVKNQKISNSENDESLMPKADSEADLRKKMGRSTRRNFLALGLGGIAAIVGWDRIKNGSDSGGLPSVLRKSHEFNESLTQSFYSPERLAPTFSIAEAQVPRINGGEGLGGDFNIETWRLQVVGVFEPKKYPQYVDDIYYDYETETEKTSDSKSSDQTGNSKDTENTEQPAEPKAKEAPKPGIPGLLLSLADIKSLPRHEMVTELKCIEGWSTKVHWAGARLSDFIEKHAPQTRNGAPPDVINNPQSLAQYVGIQTPDEAYYVGLDMPSAMHPQTLLCYEMNGEPLALEHGAPLRLVTPLKYGIKHIKRIGRITFTDERPKDFWAERGYDWYSGH